MPLPRDRSRAIFGHPPPPSIVWERQFDGFDQELARLAQTEWQIIQWEELWYYLHDLAYVELQPELFHYLFPVCLKFWRDSLMQNQPAAIGDAEFHYALHHGKSLERMVTPAQREAIYRFLHDAVMERLDAERGFTYTGASTPAYAWMQRFNSLGCVAPVIEIVWTSWWKFDSIGKAVAALQYASGFIYLRGDNPIFGMWTPEHGGGGPYLTENDAHIFDAGWLQENLDFLRRTLSAAYIQNKLQWAVNRLQGEPEALIAAQVAQDAWAQEDVMTIRIEDLIEGLSNSSPDESWREKG